MLPHTPSGSDMILGSPPLEILSWLNVISSRSAENEAPLHSYFPGFDVARFSAFVLYRYSDIMGSTGPGFQIPFAPEHRLSPA